jgi:hypothetical protein
MFRTKISRVIGLLTVALIAGTCLAEDAAPQKFYKLDFVVKEVDGGKVLNARTYSAVVSTERGLCSIRTGNRVPYSTGDKTSYLDVGVSIDCRSVKEVPGELTLRLDADVSSVVQESTTPTNFPPVVRQNKWASDIIVPLKKPTVIFSSDDLTTKHQMQLELTATPIT